MYIDFDYNSKTVFTRMCIGEAIIRMLKTTDFQKLKISEIVKTAGVARMTFYKYYDSPYTALVDYMHIIVYEYLQTAMEDHKKVLVDQNSIVKALLFYDRYADFFLTLDQHNLYSIMQDAMNAFMERKVHTSEQGDIYGLYCYSGALLNLFIQWEKRGKKERAEDVASYFCRFIHAEPEADS